MNKFAIFFGAAVKDSLRDFLDDESGQGITEYGAILAFVALLVAVLFSFAQGSMTAAVSQSFSTIVHQLNDMTKLSSSKTN